MHRKLLKAGLAGVAALGLAAGGTTFAAWSDYGVKADNQAGADKLALNLNEPGTTEFDKLNMYPGGSGDFEFIVASRQGDAVPNASLTLALVDLLSNDNACSSQTEEDVDDCEAVTEGEFDDEARIIVNASNVISNIASVSNACDSSAYPRGGRQSSISIRDFFNQTGTTKLNVLPAGETLQAGEGICVALGINLPSGATNAVQGDDVDFDLRFDLAQV